MMRRHHGSIRVLTTSIHSRMSICPNRCRVYHSRNVKSRKRTGCCSTTNRKTTWRSQIVSHFVSALVFGRASFASTSNDELQVGVQKLCVRKCRRQHFWGVSFLGCAKMGESKIGVSEIWGAQILGVVIFGRVDF